MEITKEAVVGTLESSDAMIQIAPCGEIDITISSSVGAQFKEAIEKVIQDTLEEFKIKKAKIVVKDKGALDCVLRARMITAITRSTNEKIEWKQLI
ncbi:citrate lyase acyl carrier protein [Apibacter raozihei]|uniref:citrate lyase acyl carrier protein n=1 Tax=Apibacter TaxID=1778601 RepID=UPI000FE31903|nr:MULTISPECIES: citrate lyase acyl carrier protein [Apibacter]